MTINVFDLLIVDPDLIAFFLGVFPSLRAIAVVVAAVAIPLLILAWRIDPFRLGRWMSAGGASLCLTGLVALSFAEPEREWEPFQGVNHLSNFARSGVTQIPGIPHARLVRCRRGATGSRAANLPGYL